VANIFIWVILLIGLFDIVVRQDYILGYSLSILTLCKFLHLGLIVSIVEGRTFRANGWLLALAIRQFEVKIIALQWIFAIVIFAVFLVTSIYISTTKYYGRDSLFRSVAHPESTDRERQPLLNEEA
jgi:hypothetical protein